jgi:hypothetical protein
LAALDGDGDAVRAILVQMGATPSAPEAARATVAIMALYVREGAPVAVASQAAAAAVNTWLRGDK